MQRLKRGQLRPRVRSAWSFTWPRSHWPCSFARPPCGASSAASFSTRLLPWSDSPLPLSWRSPG